MLKTPYKSDRMLLEKMLYSNINGNTVSYTHLDVYKRQEQECAEATISDVREGAYPEKSQK